MSEPFIGEIRLFGFNFAPYGWAMCDGQLLSIAQNSALFSLLGTYYGGNGQTTFALPDLRGRVPINQGQGPGLSAYVLGQSAGAEHITLLTSQMPAHNHTVNASGLNSDVPNPSGAVPGKTGASSYNSGTPNVQMNAQMIGVAGGGQPVNIQDPYLVVNFCIALQGLYPSRN